ncbi:MULTISPECIES: MBL fold metallo-hydrolase [unclassified Pseudoalteromonas]|jgi:hydroxyacylglutathione hydrolase|uniref:MBL fold metallo-hydrolase n=2 Tax=Pseudoalteromonas TaxID=53246 RepID=UPI0003FFA8B3|nr:MULTISPECIES: MBL fold metallo-hydrolase [unclassified Pseudoalteromonas]TMP47966.1 MBL fold metallo-hydrolase [Pseudoalteromonas sp. S1688]
MQPFLSKAQKIGKCLLPLICLFMQTKSEAAIEWQPLSANIQFLKQPERLRFYDSNQVLIEGSECALLVDASGNFAAVEQLVTELKQRLKTPLCYLVATHFHDDHLLGMAVMQHYFPDAKLITHQQVANDFSLYQQALTDKLEGFEKSIELSYQRLATLPDAEQVQWREKLTRAKKRLFRWQDYQLTPPKMSISESKTLDLGGYTLTINPHQAHTNGDLTLLADKGKTLIGGDIIDWLPYPGHGELKQWQCLLKKYINNNTLSLFIPGHGDLVDKVKLKQSLTFLEAITEHAKNNPEASIEQLQKNFPIEALKPYQQEPLDIKSSHLFLQSGLLRAKNSQ